MRPACSQEYYQTPGRHPWNSIQNSKKETIMKEEKNIINYQKFRNETRKVEPAENGVKNGGDDED